MAAATSQSQVEAIEKSCFALAVLLHHARTTFLSGEAHDDGLGLFEQQTDSELLKMLGRSRRNCRMPILLWLDENPEQVGVSGARRRPAQLCCLHNSSGPWIYGPIDLYGESL